MIIHFEMTVSRLGVSPNEKMHLTLWQTNINAVNAVRVTCVTLYSKQMCSSRNVQLDQKNGVYIKCCEFD